MIGRITGGGGEVFAVNGRIDRLVVLPDRILVADFKTDRVPPSTPAEAGDAMFPSWRSMAPFCRRRRGPGYNDGEQLEYSLSELAKLGPNVQSIAVVPVGLTAIGKLTPLRGFFPQEAVEVVKTMERWGEYFCKEYGTRTAYASDEFYILAGKIFRRMNFMRTLPSWKTVWA